MTYKILILKSIRPKLRRWAIKIYPKEFYCFLLGNIIKNRIFINNIYIPPDLEEIATKDTVQTPDYWFTQAKTKGTVVGCFHTHPDCFMCDASESDQDHIQMFKKWLKTPIIFGIGSVRKKDGKFMTRTRFWPYA